MNDYAMAFNSVNYMYKSVLLNVSPIVYLLLLELLFSVCKSATPAEINKHLELGRDFLARGQLSDALNHYHAAVEGDPNNYLTYFKRGTVYLALGKAKNALSDLDKVLELKPDFTAARLSRGSVHLKQANFDLAQLDFYNVLTVDPYNPDATDFIHRIEPTRERFALAQNYYQAEDYYMAIQYLTAVLETSPWSSEIRQLRADCYMRSGDRLAAVTDIRSATRLQSDNTLGYYKLSQILYELGHATDALKEIRECLKLDPEHKDCFPFYKKVKKVEKFLTEAENAVEQKDYLACIESAQKVLKNEKEVQMIMFNGQQYLCSCYVKDEQTSQAIAACREALEIAQEPNVYCDRAEAYIQSEMYDDAIRDYKSALEIDETFARAKEGMQRAQKLQHQAEKRDYYKILGVKRSATKREIVKAYRKAAQKWHPDNFQGDEKKIAEKKFIDIAAAKEVLTDEEKRQQFDNGEDPLDPEQQGGRGGGAHHFHNFQYGSPFQFRFHFN